MAIRRALAVVLAGISAGLAMFSCTTRSAKEGAVTAENPAVAWLKTADPEADAQQAWDAGDRRFRAVHAGALNFQPFVPAVSNEWSEARIHEHGYQLIEGVIHYCMPGPNPDMDRAINYAGRYNAAVRKRLEQ